MADQSKCRCGEVTTAFKNRMTIQNYARLRRQYPQANIDIRMFNTLEFAYADHGLDDFEIESGLLYEALTGNRPAICELSLTLLELIAAREQAERNGATHLVSRGIAISDAMVNQLINRMIDGLLDSEDPRLPTDLVILIRHQTGGVEYDWEKEEKARKRQSAATELAVDLALKGEVPTARVLAHALGVNPSTVVRWLPEGSLEQLRALAQMVGQGAITVKGSILEGDTTLSAENESQT